MINYTTAEEATKPENKDKVVISKDAYAVCDLLDKLMNEITRVSLI